MNIFQNQAFPIVLIFEGGDRYTEMVGDKGGATKFGITQKTYDGYRTKLGQKKQPVKDIFISEVPMIYLSNYWEPMKCSKFGEATSIVIFDTAVNMGCSRAAKLLQKSLEIKQDGIIGSETINKSQLYQDSVMARLFLMERSKFYQAIVKNDPTQGVFLKGWLRRITYLSDYIEKRKTLEQIKAGW